VSARACAGVAPPRELCARCCRGAEPVDPDERPLAAGLVIYDTLRHRLQSARSDAFTQEMCRALVRSEGELVAAGVPEHRRVDGERERRLCVKQERCPPSGRQRQTKEPI
jgi:hypothetical protein